MTKLESMALRVTELLAASLAANFASIRELHPDEHFYGIALGLDNDWFSFQFIANSHEVIEREVLERARRCGVPVDKLERTSLLWVPGWEYCVRGTDDAGWAHDSLWNECYGGGKGPFEYDAVKMRVWRAVVEAFHKFVENGGLNGYDRNDFVLIPWIHDPDRPDLVMSAAAELNTPSMGARFLAQYSYRSYASQTSALHGGDEQLREPEPPSGSN